MKTGTKVHAKGTDWEYESLVVEVPSGRFELSESADGGVRIEALGPSSLAIEGGNRHSVWSMHCDKSIVFYRSAGGEVKKLNYDERMARRKEIANERKSQEG